jgi:L-ascorbate metabolism protein UlaG (beta-lactamase superfamily)
MQAPFLADDAFLDDVHVARRDAPNQLHIWWLGQSGFLVDWQGKYLLFDPYLSDSLTNKYAATDNPHVRMTGRVVDPACLDFIDVVTSTHNHTDHLDAETLKPLLAANPTIALIAPEANRAFVAERLGVEPARVTGLDDGITETVDGFRITGVPAAHEALERDDLGRCKFLGYIVEAGPWTIYHSGDTIFYPGMPERLRQWPVDVALLPINGRSPERKVAGNLSGPDAAKLAHDIHAATVIPCHYDMFAFNTAAPDEFVVSCESLGQPYRVLRNGERWSVGE